MEFELTKPQIITHVEKSVSYTLFGCKWIPETAKFTVLGSYPKQTGIIELFEVGMNDVKSVKKIECDTSVKVGTFGASPSGCKNLACGDFNGNFRIWDLETSNKIYDVKAHEQIINTIDGMGGKCGDTTGPPEVATGSRDGSVKIWDVRQKVKPVAVIEPGEGESRRDCWAVAFGNSHTKEDRMICTGYDNGDIKMFDLREMKVIWEKNLKNGICSIQFDRNDIPMNKLIVTTLESKFHIFDLRTLHPKLGFNSIAEKAHKSTVWTGCHLPQNRDLFMTSGGSGSLCLWKYTYPSCRVKKDSDGLDVGVMGVVELLQNMTLSTQPISSFDWCAEKQGLAICTGLDQIIRLIIVTKLNNY